MDAEREREMAAAVRLRTEPAAGDVIEVGNEAGLTQRVVVHSTESNPNGHLDWVRMIVSGGAVLLMRRADVKIVKRFDAVAEEE